MRTPIIRCIMVTALALTGFIAAAQIIDKEQMQLRAAERVEQLADYIELMADKSIPAADRMEGSEQALHLFVGCGDAYEENGRIRNGVIMEVTSRWRKNPIPRPIKKYFTGLINLKYNHVKINGANVSTIKVSDLRKRPDGTYSCVCTFLQEFIGYSREGKVLLRDTDRKSVTCIISVDETEWGIEYVVKLGDVRVVED